MPSGCQKTFNVWLVYLPTHQKKLLFNELGEVSTNLPEPIAWSLTNDIVFDTYDLSNDTPYAGLWSYSVSTEELEAIDPGRGYYNGKLWLSPDRRMLLTTGSNTDNINSFNAMSFPTSQIKLINLETKEVTIVVDLPEEQDYYYVRGWIQNANLPEITEWLSSSMSVDNSAEITDANTGFQRPMTNHHYGWEWLDWTGSVYHPGDDYNGPSIVDGNSDCGTAVYAVANGTVKHVNTGSWGGLVIEHTWNSIRVYSQYGHISSPHVSNGQTVSKGQHVADVGNVGTTWCHLHWEIRESDHPNPTDGNYWSNLNVLSNVENWYEDPEWWVDNHGPYSSGCGNYSYNGIVLFENSNCSGGTRQYNSAGFRNLSDFNDVTSSIHVGSGWSVKVYEHSDKNGSSRCINGSMWDLSVDKYTQGNTGLIINDTISSIEVFNNSSCTGGPPTPEHSVQFYKNANYDDGYCYGDTAGNYMNIDGCSGYNDQISSVLLKSGWSVRVYEHGNLEGGSKCYTGSDSDFSNDTFDNGVNVNDRISSFSLYNQSSCPSPVPNAPSLSSPSNGSSHSYDYDLTFSWNASSGASEYLLEWWGGPYGTMQPCGWNSSRSCHIGTVASGHTYYWHVKARNSSGESGWSSTWSFTIQSQPQPPSAPSLSSPSNGSSHSYDYDLTFSWNASSGASDYILEWWGGPYNIMQPCGWSSSQSCHIGTVTAGHTYYWHVKARNSSGESGWSDTWSFTIQPNIPNTPENFRVSGATQTSITIAWDDTSNETGYKIYKWDWISSFVYIASVGANVTSYTDNTLTCGSNAYYEVSAYNSNGESAHAGWVMGTTDSCPGVLNDDMANAILISSLPYSNVQSSLNATLETNEPIYICGGNESASVWYKFSPSTNGIFSVDTYGSDYDTVLHIFDQNGTNLTPKGCNDQNGNSDQSKVAFSAYAGNDYLIAVTHWNGGNGGNLTIHLAKVSCPAASLCMTVLRGDGSSATYPDVQVFNPSGDLVTQAQGSADGYVEISSLTAGTYKLVTSDWKNFIVNEGVSVPGIYSASAQNLPITSVSAKNKSGTSIETAIVFADSLYGYGYVGYSYPDTPLEIYASPGSYDITAIGYDDRYVLSLENRVVGSGGTTITLDASKMPTDILSFDWDGFTSGNFHSRAPFTRSYWFWIPVADGESVTLSVPEAYYSIWYEPVLVDGNDTWKYRFYDCCYTTSGNSDSSFDVGGIFTPLASAWNDPYGPGETGELYTDVEDDYGNWMTVIWHWDDSASTSIIMDNRDDKQGGGAEPDIPQEDGIRERSNRTIDSTIQGAWVEILPDFQVKDALGNIVNGSLAWEDLNASYEFNISNPANLGSWQGQVTVDFGPYQTDGRDTINFDVVAPPTNDDFSTPIVISAIPYNGTINTNTFII